MIRRAKVPAIPSVQNAPTVEALHTKFQEAIVQLIARAGARSRLDLTGEWVSNHVLGSSLMFSYFSLRRRNILNPCRDARSRAGA